MDLKTILAIFEETDASEWHAVHPVDWGERKAPLYRMVYKPDVALGVEWGATVEEAFHQSWLDRYANKAASSHVAQITYNGSAVYQQHYVDMDERNMSLPLPEVHFKENEAGFRSVDYYSVTERAVKFMRLLNDVLGREKFDTYLRSTGIRILP